MVIMQSNGSRIEHWGQHGDECFGCKLKTVKFGSVGPPTHNPKKGDRWETDPVQQRIMELTEQGRKRATLVESAS